MRSPSRRAAAAALLGLALLQRPAPASAAYPLPVGAPDGMVVSAQHLATDAGVTILREGGNAVDAAVATAWALAVTYPEAGNLGGGGFMTVRPPNGHTAFLDFREKAPRAATANMYLDAHGNVVPGRSTDGWLAVGVPGSVAGLETARRIWGHLGRAAVMAPAIALARDGFVLTQGDLVLLDAARTRLLPRFGELRPLLERPDGAPLMPGDRLRQPALARTLELISRSGPDAFYHGPIGREIVRASHAGGGILEAADFDSYRTRLLKPVSCTYRGYLVESAPPPSSGGVVLCEILDVLDGIDMAPLGFHSAAAVHDMAEAMRHAYHDRNALLGDPDFVHPAIGDLLGPAHAAAIRAAIEPDRATPSASLPPVAPNGPEGHTTTHLVAVDRDGLAVSLTTTLNAYFGAKVVGGSTGIVMNDEMDDFTAKPGVPNMFGLVQGAQNAIAPGKTPLSSMSPTIVSRDGRLVMAVGSPGGSRIPTIVLEAILNAIDLHMDIAAAIDAPRIHEQWLPDVIEAEAGALSPDTRRALAAMGYAIREGGEWGEATGIMAGAPGIGATPPPGMKLFGAADVRAAAGSAAGE